MAKRRKFTAQFKAEVVLKALRGESSQAQMCRCHNLSENQVSTWKRQLLENVETFFEPADQRHSGNDSGRILGAYSYFRVYFFVKEGVIQPYQTKRFS